MTVAENAIVVDKNIWLDFYLHERPLHEEAARFIRVAEKYNANLGTPADAVNEVFYTARAINNFAWGCVDHMTDLAISVPMDDRTAWLARHYRDITSDYEDASVLASCELCKANYLVTHDKRLAAQANIATKTATEMADLITRAHGE